PRWNDRIGGRAMRGGGGDLRGVAATCAGLDAGAAAPARATAAFVRPAFRGGGGSNDRARSGARLGGRLRAGTAPAWRLVRRGVQGGRGAARAVAGGAGGGLARAVRSAGGAGAGGDSA